jgi:DNA-binding beta-propeller fold protein YncE
MRRHLALATLGLLVACGGTAGRSAATPSSTPRSSPAAPGTAAAIPPADTAANRLWLLRAGAQRRIDVVEPASRRQLAQMGSGVASPDWSRLYTVSVEGGNAIVVVDPATGAVLDRVPVDPFLDLPAGPGTIEGRAGLSPDGRRLVLTGGPRDSSGRLTSSSFAVFDTAALHTSPHSLSLAGEWYFDGIDNAGHSLYLIHPLSSRDGRYEVRHYDLVAGWLDSNPVARKILSGRDEGPMTGVPLDRVNSRDGQWQYTLYGLGAEGPFIHGLDLEHGTAICLDLPGAGSNGGSERELLWSLAINRDGRVYAVNAATGHAAELDSASPFAMRVVALPVPSPSASPAAWWSFGSTTVAEAKRGLYGGSSLSPDGATLYAVAEHGIAVIETRTLKLLGLMLRDHDLQSLRVSPDGKWLYAVDAGQAGGLLQVDAATGASLALSAYSDAAAVLRVTPSG